MLHDGNKHSGNTAKPAAMFAAQHLQRLERIEGHQGMQGRANAYRGHDAQHAAARVEEWHGGTNMLSLLRAPAQGEDSAVVEDGALRLDGSFGKAGRAGGVEDLRRVGGLHRCLPLMQSLHTHLFASRDHLAEKSWPPAVLL